MGAAHGGRLALRVTLVDQYGDTRAAAVQVQRVAEVLRGDIELQHGAVARLRPHGPHRGQETQQYQVSGQRKHMDGCRAACHIAIVSLSCEE